MKTICTYILISTILATGCDTNHEGLTNERKKELKSRFCNPHYVMPDTLIHYTLYADSMVLRFQPKAHYTSWCMQMILRDRYANQTNAVDLGNYDKLEVHNNEIVLRNFHISPDSVDFYVPDLFAFPYTENGLFIVRKPVENLRMFFRKQGTETILTPWGPGSKQNYMSFNLRILPELTKEERAYCREIFFKATGIETQQ